MTKIINFKINGENKSITIEKTKRLIDFLREDLNLTGTKEGCGIGECGACSVILNGELVNSCLVLSPQIDGCEIITIEGLTKEKRLNKLQENFLKYGAVQCGFCTPGMLLAAYSLLMKNEHPSEEEIKVAISGNLCRCTGYKQIIDAINASGI